jgi:chorismate mutase/GNAT superfamily N-acetyltransferase/SAM-dependent methyltransferase
VTSTERSADLTDVQLRPATPDDAAALAEVHLASRKAATPAMPPSVHPDEDALPWVTGWLAENEVWVAEVDGAAVGYASMTTAWLDGLFVAPDYAGRGIGTLLLDVVKSLRPDGFALWVFESNTPARRFYERHGLVELEHTDGSANEERAPDVRMAWPGRDPMHYLRAQVDEVDDDLAHLLARRAALTATIQEFKDVPGHAGRDPERETEIAQRMARHAPALGVEGLRRIMHEVIGVSLDAVEEAEAVQARAATVAAYEQDAEAYARNAQPLHPDLTAMLDSFVALLQAGDPVGGRVSVGAPYVLEVGSGPGRDAAALEERGVRVRRTDVAGAFVRRLRGQGYDADQLDPLVDDLAGPYDGVLASAVLLHLSRQDCATVLRRLRGVVRPGGVLAVSVKEGDGAGWSRHGSIRDPRWFTYWRSGPFVTLLEGAGWRLTRLDRRAGRSEAETSWLHVLATAQP